MNMLFLLCFLTMFLRCASPVATVANFVVPDAWTHDYAHLQEFSTFCTNGPFAGGVSSLDIYYSRDCDNVCINKPQRTRVSIDLPYTRVYDSGALLSVEYSSGDTVTTGQVMSCPANLSVARIIFVKPDLIAGAPQAGECTQTFSIEGIKYAGDRTFCEYSVQRDALVVTRFLCVNKNSGESRFVKLVVNYDDLATVFVSCGTRSPDKGQGSVEKVDPPVVLRYPH